MAMVKTRNTIAKIALNAVAWSMPCEVKFGTVVSTSPLKIQVEQKLTLEEQHLILTSNVKDFTVNMTMEHFTEETSGGSGYGAFDNHRHEYKGKKQFTIHLGLSPGEKVILLRVQGGQKYIVLDRI